MRGDGFAGTCAFFTAAALALIAAFGIDSKVSSYAVDHAPVYGSAARAQKASDVLQYVSAGAAAVIYAVKYFRPADELFRYPYRMDVFSPLSHESAMPPVNAAMAFVFSGLTTSMTTELLKDYTGRERPNAADNLSFPSGHATAAAWANHSSILMIRDMNLPLRYEIPAYTALSLLTLGTAWGRVEAAKHYPTDVLAGMLIGIALTDASFALFQNGANQRQADNTRFNIQFSNERIGATTGLLMTVDF